MTTGVQISSNNFNGQIANITFYPDTGGTISLGANILPYTVELEYVYGSYELYFGAYDRTCFAYISNPGTDFLLQENYSLILQEDNSGLLLSGSPTPTPTQTTTPTVTPTNTPTPSITASQTPTNTVTPTNTNTPTVTTTQTPTVTPSPTSNMVTSGLIIELDAYNIDSYPGTGTTVFDLVNNYDHTLTTAPYTVLSGIKCFDCNGVVNTQIRVNITGPTLPTTGYTYISWVRIKNNTTTYRTLYRTAPNDHPLLIDINTNNLGFYDNDTPAFFTAGYSVVPIVDTWVQLTVVGDSTGSTFYVNTTQVGTTAKGAGGMRHDYWGSIPGQPFGYVANMYYYNRKLSLSQITQQYNFLLPRFA